MSRLIRAVVVSLFVTTLLVSIDPSYAETVPPGNEEKKAQGLMPQQILDVIRANLNQIRHCYELALETAPGMSGKVAVRFTVDLAGAVSKTEVSDATITNEKLTTCMLLKISRWKFPKPKGNEPVVVNYPFTFNPL